VNCVSSDVLEGGYVYGHTPVKNNTNTQTKITGKKGSLKEVEFILKSLYNFGCAL
jgi:hypothetical protein